MKVPGELIYPLPAFRDSYADRLRLGRQFAADASVVFVGLARNCADHLAANLVRLESLASCFASWQLHIETNDNTDGTDQVLVDFAAAHRQATFTSQRLGRQQYTTEFAGRRTEALAEYRTACQHWVREHARTADYVVVIDWDAWGGWSHDGVLAGLGWLHATTDAYGMASVSLLRHRAPGGDSQWLQYDCWALRLNSAWDDYTAGVGGWKHVWLPPVGSPPVPVVSAFGGFAIYDTHAYLRGEYDGSDCEHVGFHRTAAEKTGHRLYLCPAMRTVMRWDSPDEATDARDSLNSL